MIKRNRHHRRAVTYIEVMFALMVLSGAVLTGSQLMGTYVQGTQIEEQQIIARELANDLLNEIKAKPFGDMANQPNDQGDSRMDRLTVSSLEGVPWSTPECNYASAGDYYPLYPNPKVVECHQGVISDSLRGYKRSVAVQCVDPNDLMLVARECEDNDRIAVITVTVEYFEPGNTTDGKLLHSVSAYKGKHWVDNQEFEFSIGGTLVVFGM